MKSESSDLMKDSNESSAAEGSAAPGVNVIPEQPDLRSAAAFVYIVKCSDGTYYTGWSTDPQRRLKVHNSGKGAKYTRSRLPVDLVYTEQLGTKQEAMSREWAIKHLTRKQKEELICNYAEKIEKGTDSNMKETISG